MNNLGDVTTLLDPAVVEEIKRGRCDFAGYRELYRNAAVLSHERGI